MSIFVRKSKFYLIFLSEAGFQEILTLLNLYANFCRLQQPENLHNLVDSCENVPAQAHNYHEKSKQQQTKHDDLIKVYLH